MQQRNVLLPFSFGPGFCCSFHKMHNNSEQTNQVHHWHFRARAIFVYYRVKMLREIMKQAFPLFAALVSDCWKVRCSSVPLHANSLHQGTGAHHSHWIIESRTHGTSTSRCVPKFPTDLHNTHSFCGYIAQDRRHKITKKKFNKTRPYY